MTESEAWATAYEALVDEDWTLLLIACDAIQECGQEERAVTLRWFVAKGRWEWEIRRQRFGGKLVLIEGFERDTSNYLVKADTLAELVDGMKVEKDRLRELYSD